MLTQSLLLASEEEVPKFVEHVTGIEPSAKCVDIFSLRDSLRATFLFTTTAT